MIDPKMKKKKFIQSSSLTYLNGKITHKISLQRPAIMSRKT
jgi:hypothetical protein